MELLPSLLLAALAAFESTTPDPAALVAKMAANMEASLDARRQYVYQQTVRARILRTNGQPAREELRHYSAIPGPRRTEKKLESLAGKYHKSKKEIIEYTEAGFTKGGLDIDGEMIDDLVDSLVDSKSSPDGIPHRMFPLRKSDLGNYNFSFLGSAQHEGRLAHRVAFEPKNKKSNCLDLGDGDGDKDDEDSDSSCRGAWKGEALIDAEEAMPLRLTSDSTFRMPGAVKVFLGTNIQQVGFNVTYIRVAPGVYFPATYGTEFRLDVLFGYKRVITLSLASQDFKRANAESDIKFDTPPL